MKRLEAALLRDPLSEELDRAAFLDAEVERQPSAPLVIRYGEECRGRASRSTIPAVCLRGGSESHRIRLFSAVTAGNFGHISAARQRMNGV